MRSWQKLALWAGVSVVAVAGLGVVAVVLIDANTDRGHWAAAAEIVVPGIIGLGAIVVAVASWQTAQRATKIASDAAGWEAERLREDRRERYDWRLDEAMVKIAKLLAAHRLLLVRIHSWEIAGKPTAKLRIERSDRAFELGSELGIVGMVTRGEDSEVIGLIQSALRKAATHPDEQHMKLVMAISAVAQVWRSSQPQDGASAKRALASIVAGGVMVD